MEIILSNLLIFSCRHQAGKKVSIAFKMVDFQSIFCRQWVFDAAAFESGGCAAAGWRSAEPTVTLRFFKQKFSRSYKCLQGRDLVIYLIICSVGTYTFLKQNHL